jgi:ribosome-associated protein
LAQAAQLAQLVSRTLDDQKAEAIEVISLTGKCSFADVMVVASGRSSRHVAALADYVSKSLKEEGAPVLSIEGQAVGDWVLIDAGDVVVHLFRPEVRQFYNLEKMWSAPAPADAR